jgi:hypothetical protein
VVAEGGLESFGQPENTVSRFSLLIPDSVEYDLSACQFHMVSNMDRDVDVVHPDTATKENLLSITTLRHGSDPDHARIKLDTPLRQVRVKVFCGGELGGDMVVSFDMRNADTFVDEVILPLSDCRQFQVWIEGYGGPEAADKRRYYGPLSLD